MAGYTREEIEFILQHRSQLTNREIAEKLGRTEAAISRWLSKNSEVRPVFRWTNEAVELLKTSYQSVKAKELCKTLGCSLSALKAKKFELRLVADEVQSSRIKRGLSCPIKPPRYTISHPNHYTTIVRRSA